MEKTREQVLKEKYGFDKSSYKYITPGAEILKCIGQTVVFVDFVKDSEGNWTNTYKQADIYKINDFDPLTMTYNCTFKVADETETREVRIIPEGFSWGDPEETGKMCRFVPLSLHYQLAQDEAFYNRLHDLYETRETLEIEKLKNISDSKEMLTQLRYSHNICAVIKLQDGSILCTRILKLFVRHNNGEKFTLRIENEDRYWSVVVKSGDTDYDFENGIGRFKIIDLADM